MKKELSLTSNIIWNSVGSTIYTILQALTTILVVRLTNFSVAGNLSLAFTITIVFFNIAHYNLRNYQVSDLKPKYSSGIYISTRIITGIVSFLLCVIFLFLYSATLEQKICIILYMFFRLGEVLLDTFYAIDQKAGRMDIISKSFIMRGLFLFISFVLVLYFTKSLNLSILAMGVSTLIVAYFYDIPWSKKFESLLPIFNFTKNKQLLIEVFPLAITLIISSFIISVPRFFLEHYKGIEQLGIYTSVASPIIIVQVLATYILTPILTVLSKNVITKDIKTFSTIILKSTITLIVMSIITIIGAFIFGEIGLTILFGKEILKYSYLFIPAIIYSILTIFVQLLSNIFIVIRRLIILGISNVIALISCFILAPIFIIKSGMNGVNYTLILSTVIQLVFMVIILIILTIPYINYKTN